MRVPLVWLVVVSVCVALGVDVASAQTAYTVSRQTGSGEEVGDLPMFTMQYLGPFTTVRSSSDPTAYAGTWQGTRSLGFSFPFFGTSYTTVTVTSKGFMYLGSPTTPSLSTVQDAPDYSATGSGFQSSLPVISFLQTPYGSVSTNDVTGSAGAYYLKQYTYGNIPAIGQHISGSSYYVAPSNSIATSADGQRFLLSAQDFFDEQTGVKAQVSVVLYASGLIEMFYYTINPSAVDFYNNALPDAPISIGIQGTFSSGSLSGIKTHYSLTTPSVSRQTWSSLNMNLQGDALSFKPSFSA